MYSLKITGATPEELYVNCLNMLADFVRRAQQGAAVVDQPGASEQTAAPAKAAAVGRKKSPDLNDDISDIGGAKKLTMDGDIRPRLRAIQEAHEKRGNDMAACVAYMLRLYEPFGIKNAKLLKPEQFEDFMKASEAYLDGTAK